MKQLKALLVEDSEADAALITRALEKAGFSATCKRVCTADEMRAALNSGAWDIVLSDYVMPGFGGLEAIALAREKDPNLPLIVVSGQIGEDTAVEAMKAGARDYIGKANLTRLGPAVERELLEAEDLRRRKKAEDEIEQYHAKLEDLVSQRTAALTQTNRTLEMEISGRRMVEQALRDAEAKSSAMIKHAPTGICEIDFRTSRLVSANDAMCSLTGYTRDELLSLDANSLLDEESRRVFADRVRKHLSGEDIDASVDYRVKKKDGSVIHIVLNVSFPVNNPGVAFVVGYDVTERIKAEDERRKADERLSHLNRQLRAIRNCDQAIVRATSEKGLIDDVCRLICEEAGYRMAWVGQVEHDEARSIRPLGWGGFENGYLQNVNITWADSERGRGPTGVATRTGKTDYFQDFATELRAAPWREEALARGYRSSLAIPLKDMSGEVFAVFATYAPAPNTFDDEEIKLLEELAGDLAFGILAWRARAERARAAAILRESEEKYHNLFNNMAEEVHYWRLERDQQGQILAWRLVDANPPALKSWRVKNLDDIRGKTADEIFGPGSTEHLLPIVQKIMQERVPYSYEDYFPFAGRHFRLTSVPVGEYFVTTGSDITVIKQTEDSLRRSTAELAEANRELEAFNYSVSHDLRAPLRALEGFSELLEEDFGDQLGENAKKHVKSIRDATGTMSRLIEDMLKLSRVTRAEVVRDSLDLADVARSIATQLKSTEPARRVEFAITPGLTVNGDAQLLKILMQNLMDNAWKYSSRSPETTIEVGRKIEAGATAYFVKDQGAGFDMKYADRLFQPFQRLHSATDYPGTGIGLAIAQRVVRKHGGRIWAAGEPGKGATFWFTLE